MADTALLRRPREGTDVDDTGSGDVREGPNRTNRLSAWVAVVALLAGLAIAPPWQGTGGLPEGFAGRLVSGVLERQVDDAWSAVAVGQLVPDGARVRSSDGARLEVDGGELSFTAGTRAVLDAVTTLEAGSALTVVRDSDRAVRLGAITASGRGAWRVDAEAAPRVAVYDGGVGLRVDGDVEQALALRALEQADLLGGGLPAEPLPLRYSSEDTWDTRLLAEVFAIDRQAAQVRATLAGRFGSDPLPEDFYRGFVLVEGALAEALTRYGESDDGSVGPPGDVLLGVIATDLVRRGAALSDAEAVRRVTTLRGAGATWGIVLAVHDLGADALRGAADLALRSGPVAPPATAPEEVPTGGPTGPDGPAPEETPTGDSTEPTPEPSPTPSPSPSPSESDAAGPCQLEPCEPVNEEVDEVTDLLDDIAPGTGETIDEVVSEAPTILPPGGLDSGSG